jgi:ABC-type transporter Mla MlaB component
VLRVTTRHTDDSLSLILEGRLKGPWVGELEQAWLAAQKLSANKTFKVDLSGVTFADWRGRKLLLDMQNRGAELVGGSSFLRQMLAGTKNFESLNEN